MPQGVSLHSLPIAVRAELKSLPMELAEIVGAHLATAGALLEEDPARALRHAQAARRRAARLTVTREAVAEAAYASGEWSVALSEFRALRRMTGDSVWLAVMADCERALGRPQVSLRLIRDAATERLDGAQQIELVLVEAGARADLGQTAEAVRLLRATYEQVKARGGSARIRVGYAFADRLLADGDDRLARAVFHKVAGWDSEFITDAAERVDTLDGLVIESFEDDADELDADADEVDADDTDDVDTDEVDAGADEVDADDIDRSEGAAEEENR